MIDITSEELLSLLPLPDSTEEFRNLEEKDSDAFLELEKELLGDSASQLPLEDPAFDPLEDYLLFMEEFEQIDSQPERKRRSCSEELLGSSTNHKKARVEETYSDWVEEFLQTIGLM